MRGKGSRESAETNIKRKRPDSPGGTRHVERVDNQVAQTARVS